MRTTSVLFASLGTLCLVLSGAAWAQGAGYDYRCADV